MVVVFPRSRLCLLHENDNRLLFEMATIVPNGKNRLRKGNCFADSQIVLSLSLPNMTSDVLLNSSKWYPLSS